MSADIGLMPTSAISDPQVRAWLDRFTQAWNRLVQGEGRAVTRQEFDRLAGDAVAQMFSPGVVGGASGALNQNAAAAIDHLSDTVRRSVVAQVLEQQIGQNQDIEGRVSEALSQITREVTERTNNISSLASAINNIWAAIGGSDAVIEDGSLASVTPSAATATKWSSVVAAVTDPNTGNISSASILQETRTYANNNDSTLNALYSVRAQVDAAGKTVVGGFALAATDGAGSAPGPSIDFGVLSNKFFIGAPASGYDPATEYSTNLNFPFIVVTTPTVINGVTYAPGVFLKKATIGQASIDTAHIAQHLNSTNFNGTFDASGNIASNGSAGWALDKSGKFVINNIYARGDIHATSLAVGTVAASQMTANAIYTSHINGEQVTIARYAESYSATSLDENWGGAIVTSAANSQGAAVRIQAAVTSYTPSTYVNAGETLYGVLHILVYQGGTVLYNGPIGALPPFYSAPGSSVQYTAYFRFASPGGTYVGAGSIGYRWITVNSYIR